MLLFGRVTYEGMASYWPSQKGDIADFMNKIPKVVFSRTLKKADWSNTKLVKENAEKEVTRLKAQPGKTLFIFGSANLSSTLTRHHRSEEHTSELQSPCNLVCRLLLEKKKNQPNVFDQAMFTHSNL